MIDSKSYSKQRLAERKTQLGGYANPKLLEKIIRAFIFLGQLMFGS